MRKLLVFGALIAAAASAPAFAQEVTVSGNVTLTSDYAWRNVSQSNYDPAIQGGFDVDFGNGFYAGTWASGVDFNDASDVNLEIDFYGGYTFDLGGVDADIGAIYYAYPDSSGDINFWEVYGALSKDFGNGFSLGGSLNWDPDNETTYADASVGYAVTDIFSLSAGYGAYLEGFGEYSGFNAGAALSLHGLDFGLTYYDNDITGTDDSFVFSIGKAL